jgi:hypothetical protein
MLLPGLMKKNLVGVVRRQGLVKTFVVRPNAFVKRILAGIAVSVLSLANLVYAGSGGFSGGSFGGAGFSGGGFSGVSGGSNFSGASSGGHSFGGFSGGLSSVAGGHSPSSTSVGYALSSTSTAHSATASKGGHPTSDPSSTSQSAAEKQAVAGLPGNPNYLYLLRLYHGFPILPHATPPDEDWLRRHRHQLLGFVPIYW